MTKEEWNRYKDLEYYPDRFCACGCGGRIPVKPYHKYYGIPIYINGHGARNKPRSKEVREKISVSCKGKSSWNDGLTKEIDPRVAKQGFKSGTKFTEEHKQHLGESARRRCEERPEAVQKCVEAMKAANTNSQRSEGTKQKIGGSRKKGFASGRIKPSRSMLGKHHTKESKKKNRQSHLGITKEINPNLARTEEEKEEVRGENNPNWRGGLSNKPYPFEFSKKLKESIRRRDNYTCQLCGKLQEKNGRKLDVHHIDYVKENLDPGNLISLCRSCNPKVNGNREYWRIFLSGRVKL